MTYQRIVNVSSYNEGTFTRASSVQDVQYILKLNTLQSLDEALDFL